MFCPLSPLFSHLEFTPECTRIEGLGGYVSETLKVNHFRTALAATAATAAITPKLARSISTTENIGHLLLQYTMKSFSILAVIVSLVQVAAFGIYSYSDNSFERSHSE